MTTNSEADRVSMFYMLEDKAFLDYVNILFDDGKIEPELKDYPEPLGQNAPKRTQADEFRLAQANRLARLYEQWKIGQN